jgi:acetyl esterase/lipase
MERRDFLQTMSALGAAAGLGVANAASGKAAYDPKANFSLEVSEVPFRKNAQGRQLMARIYQPAGAGPFPVVLDLHGGAWQRKDRKAEEPMDRAIASSGVLVVAIDMTLSGEAPYPACVQDASYGVRWLKHHAAEWKGDASTLGLYGSSSGGHVAELLAMRPNDRRYNAIPFEAAPSLDINILYAATRSPISNPFTRWQQAERKPNPNLVKASRTFWVPWEAIHEGSPQEILDRKEAVVLKPLLIMQGELDDNVLATEQEKFYETYRRAGGDAQFEIFKGAVHEWVAEPGPQTTRAQEMAKAFIARQLGRVAG